MVTNWAFIYMSDVSDPDRDHLVHMQTDGGEFHIFGVASAAQAGEVAKHFVDELDGHFIELCGAFTLDEADKVREAIDRKVSVGKVVQPEADRLLFDKIVLGLGAST